MNSFKKFLNFAPRDSSKDLAKRKAEVTALANWDPLLRAVMERVSQFEETDLFMLRFENQKSKRGIREHSTLVIGCIEPMLSPASGQAKVFIHASGLVDPETVPGSEEVGWHRAGFATQQDKRGVTFGRGPISTDDLPGVLLSALDVFAMFYGVNADSSIVTLGDPEFEEILDKTGGIRRRLLGEYRLT